METQLEHSIRQHQLQLWAAITQHYKVPEELKRKIPIWIRSGKLSEKAISWELSKAVEPKVAAPRDNTPSSLHHL